MVGSRGLPVVPAQMGAPTAHVGVFPVLSGHAGQQGGSYRAGVFRPAAVGAVALAASSEQGVLRGLRTDYALWCRSHSP